MANTRYREGTLSYEIKPKDLYTIAKVKKRFNFVDIILTPDRILISGVASNASTGAKYMFNSNSELKIEEAKVSKGNETVTVETLNIDELELDLDWIDDTSEKDTAKEEKTYIRFRTEPKILDALMFIPKGIIKVQGKQAEVYSTDMKVGFRIENSYTSIEDFAITEDMEYERLNIADIDIIQKQLRSIEPDMYKHFLKIEGNRVYTYTEDIYIEGNIKPMEGNYVLTYDLLDILSRQPKGETIGIRESENSIEIRTGKTYIKVGKPRVNDVFDITKNIDMSEIKSIFKIEEKDIKKIKLLNQFSEDYKTIRIKIGEDKVLFVNTAIALALNTVSRESIDIEVDTEMFVKAYNSVGGKEVTIGLLNITDDRQLLTLKGKRLAIIAKKR